MKLRHLLSFAARGPRLLGAILISGSVLGFCLVPVACAQNGWIGPANDDWFTASDWNNPYTGASAVPTSSDYVFININNPLVSSSGAVASDIEVDNSSGSNASLTVQGNGTLSVGDTITLGDSSTGSMSILSGGQVSASYAVLGNISGSNGSLLVDGVGSNLTTTVTNNYGLLIGSDGNGSVTVSNKATLNTANSLYLAYGSGNGTLTVASGGTVNVGGSSSYSVYLGYFGSAGTGTLNIGNNGSAAGTLVASAGVYGSAAGMSYVNFDHNTIGYTFSPAIGGTIAVNQIGSGTTSLTGYNTYTGSTTVSGGGLLVDNNGTAAGAVTVSNRGTLLGGTGTIDGAVTINSGAILLGGDGSAATGTLTLSKSLTLGSGSMIELVLGSSNQHSTLTRGGGTWSFATNEAFDLINPQKGTYSGIITGLSSKPSSFSSWTIMDPGVTGAFSYSSGKVNLTISAVPTPEPATWLAGTLTVLVGASAWKRGRRPVRG